jgi:argininosuccinate lyase
MSKIWDKKSGATSDAFNDSFLISKGTPDNLLIPYDIEASKAHASMLAKIDVLTAEENEQLQQALNNLLERYDSGDFQLTPSDEDCHSAIERSLIETCGEAGKKIHTGRSRNDQVLVATRLLMQDKLSQTHEATLSLAQDFLNMARTHERVPFPGYTHTQQAMLSSLGHYFASFVESLLDDAMTQSLAHSVIDQNPLGSAAGFGVSFPLDRAMTTKTLGFERVQQNSLYCQTSRGKFESLILESLVQVMLTLGRFAQDMILFTTQEFNYFDVDESMTTGSSIMPQKKNLDYMEVLRGQVSLVISFQHQVQDLTKNHLSGYNK